MKIQALLGLLPIGLRLLGCTVSPPLQKVNSLGKVTVGQLLPSYTGVSSSGRAMGRVPSKGEFLIHLLHPELPATCVGEECGEIGGLVQSYGGQLNGASDRKLAGSVFDILPSSDSSKSFDEYGVLIVSDSRGKVVAIYDHANKNSVQTALDDLSNHVREYSRRSSFR
jgi:hypothetical protein